MQTVIRIFLFRLLALVLFESARSIPFGLESYRRGCDNNVAPEPGWPLGISQWPQLDVWRAGAGGGVLRGLEGVGWGGGS